MSLSEKLGLYDQYQLWDYISQLRGEGAFGWADEVQKKGVILSFADQSEIMLCAGGSYISVYSKDQDQPDWKFHVSHDSCWRYDGIGNIFKIDEEKELLKVSQVLVEEQDSSRNQKQVKKVTHL